MHGQTVNEGGGQRFDVAHRLTACTAGYGDRRIATGLRRTTNGVPNDGEQRRRIPRELSASVRRRGCGRWFGAYLFA